MSEVSYQDALKKARREFRACVIRGEYPYLPRLEDFLPREQISRGIDLGTVQIPMEFIAGTKSGGRTNAFARNFMPLLPEHTEFAQKWRNLCETHLSEGIRDSVTAWEYMNRFYIEEGNKRVSVLKYFGAATVPAHVTRILPQRNGSREVECYYAFVDFYRLSRINFVEFSRPESYRKLRRLLGKPAEEPWTEEERSKFAAAYYHFRKAYDESGGKRLSTTPGDALLAYLRVYGYDGLRGKSDDEIRESLSRIWEEIALQKEEQAIDVKLAPEEGKPRLILPKIGKKVLKAAFLHDKTPELSGWTYGHELGRRHVEEAFHGELETVSYCNVCDVDPCAVMKEAIAAGNTVLFTTSPRLLPASLRTAVEYPDIAILNCSLNTPHRYIRTYYARMYEAKFISGAVAGTLAGGDSIGYLCDYPIFGQVAGINAFALGVQMTNPRARVYLEWTSAKGGIAAATERLTDQNIRLISCQDLASLGNRENAGFGLSLVVGGESVRLAEPQWRWGAYYEGLLRSIRDRSFWTEYEGSGKALNYYWGMSAGVVELVCSDKLPDNTRRLAVLLRDSICSGFCDPFRGPLYAQDGRLVEESHQSFGPEQIINMDWLNENVVGAIPSYEDLDETGRATVDIMGVGPSTKEAP